MDEIKSLLYKGETDEAIRLLTDYIRENPESDEAYYLLGNAWRKKGDNRLALNNYLEAIHRNPMPTFARVYAYLSIRLCLSFFEKKIGKKWADKKTCAYP